MKSNLKWRLQWSLLMPKPNNIPQLIGNLSWDSSLYTQGLLLSEQIITTSKLLHNSISGNIQPSHHHHHTHPGWTQDNICCLNTHTILNRTLSFQRQHYSYHFMQGSGFYCTWNISGSNDIGNHFSWMWLNMINVWKLLWDTFNEIRWFINVKTD